MKKRIVSSVIMAVALIAAIGCMPKKDLFKFRYEAGQVQTFKGAGDTTIEFTFGEKVESIVQKQSFKYEQKVLSVDADHVAQVRIIIKQLKFDQDGPMGGMHFDSEKDSQVQDPMLQAFNLLINKPFILYINPRGRVVKTSGLEKIVEQIIDSLDQKQASGADRDKLADMFKKALMSHTYSGNASLFPETDPEMEQSWVAEEEVPVPGIGSIFAHIRYTYAAKNGNLATIAFRGTMFKKDETEAGGGQADDTGIPLEFNNGEVNGKILFNLKAGQLEYIDVVNIIRMQLKPLPLQLLSKGKQKITTHYVIEAVKE